MVTDNLTPKHAEDEDFDEQEGGSDLELEINKFQNLLVAPSDWTVGSLAGLIGTTIELDPDFQRRDVWTEVARSKFIESIILNIPIPQILLAARKNERNKFIVIDGKQRLLTIRYFLDGKHGSGRIFRLRGMRVLRELEGRSWEDIKDDEKYSKEFLNQTIRTVVMRGWTEEDVLFEIFSRLNSGSVKLSPMELRMSLHPGDFLRYIIRWTEETRNIQKAMHLSRPDKRMGDVELAIRFLAFKREVMTYRGDLKDYLDRFCEIANLHFSDEKFKEGIEDDLALMEKGISVIMEIFGENSFRKWKNGVYEPRFNRAIFDIMSISSANGAIRDWMLKNSDAVESAFKEICEEDSEFLTSLETTTKSISAVNKRFLTWQSKIEKLSGMAFKYSEVSRGHTN